jgi:hypothetical protein
MLTPTLCSAEFTSVRRTSRNPARALDQGIKLDPDNYLANLNLMRLYGRNQDPRAEGQSRHFAELSNKREERAKLFLRTVEVVP